MRVSELMKRNVVTVGPEHTCGEAMARMLRWGVRHLPVVAGDGSLRGVLTDRDLRRHLFSPDVFPQVGRVPLETLLRARRVGDIMSAPAICLGAVAELEEAASLMRDHRIGSVPVVEGGRVVGILTETDLLRHVARLEGGPELEIIVAYP
jgi:acetoin utilization protein AcuB